MDVADWLRQLGLERYQAAFRQHDVGAAVLPSLGGLAPGQLSQQPQTDRSDRLR